MTQHTSVSFERAVAAIDAGDVAALARLLSENPQLVHQRLDEPAEGYFAHPYLLWFVAGNPVRNEVLPKNIGEVTRAILQAGATKEQADSTLSLVASGRVPRESGVQLELIDLLIAHGAQPDGAMLPALVHKELGAVRRLLDHGARMTLAAAIGLDRTGDVLRLLPAATPDELQTALTAAAFYGHPHHLRMVIEAGADLGARSPRDFHPHATPLHQAVFSGSLDAVKTLVEAGADAGATDHAHGGTPLGWAEYLQHPEIAAYLRSREC